MIDALAQDGFSRGADSYDRGRPGYPLPSIAWVCAAAGITSGRRVLDLGAGTGKLSRQVREVSGAEVIAVEPVAEMRAIAARHGLPVIEAPAEALPVATASVDAVICGEAFHWFDGERALDEIARVLRPGGGIGLLWNVHLWDAEVPWMEAIDRLIGPHSDGRAETRYGSGRWRAAFERDPRWAPLEQRSFTHEQRLDAAGLVAQVDSISFVAALPDAERAALLDELGRVAPPDVTIGYRTDAYASSLRTRSRLTFDSRS
jgi:SAM-dependent methyltransferase